MSAAAKLLVAPPVLPYEIVGSARDRDRWLALRKSGIGASEIAAVLGESPWRSAYELFAEKTGRTKPEDLSDVEAVDWGLRLEPVIVRAYAERTGRPTADGGHLLRSLEHPWALATLDAWTAGAEGESEAIWPLEVKTTGAQNAERWAEGPPREYFWQCQQQMLVTGSVRCTIACLIGGQRLVWCDVERDEIAQRKLIFHGAEFWARVEQGNAPPVDGGPGVRKVLEHVYGREAKGSTVALAGELAELDHELVTAKSERSALERRIETLENTIRDAIGSHETGVINGVATYTWKTEERGEFTVKASSRRVLRRKAWKGAA